MLKLGIMRGYGVVLRHQAKRYECFESLFDTYIISEEKFRARKDVSSSNLKYIGNMSPIQCVALDKNNIDKFLNETIKKFRVIMTQGEHCPLSLLINKYAKKHGILTIDVHQANDYYDKYFKMRLPNFLLSYVDLGLKALNSNFRSLLTLLARKDRKLLSFVIKNYNKAGFRFFRDIPEEYRFDRCYVYGNRCKQNYKLMGYHNNDVVVIGAPDLSEYEKNKFKVNKYSSEKKYVLYIDSQYIDQFNFLDRFNFFAKSIINEGYDFLFYPHPNLSDDFLDLIDKGVTVLPKSSINSYIDNADFVFVHQSNMIDLLVYTQKRFCLLYDKNFMQTDWYARQELYSKEIGVNNESIENIEQIKGLLKNFEIDKCKFNKYLIEECGNFDIHKKGRDALLMDDLASTISHRNSV